MILSYDTDSFFLNISTEDVYEDLNLIQDCLDTSIYPETNSLFLNMNKKGIGKFKDELDGQIMSELVFLSKAYAFKVIGKEVKKLKGITKSTIKHDITFQDFKDAITEPYLLLLLLSAASIQGSPQQMFSNIRTEDLAVFYSDALPDATYY